MPKKKNKKRNSRARKTVRKRIARKTKKTAKRKTVRRIRKPKRTRKAKRVSKKRKLRSKRRKPAFSQVKASGNRGRIYYGLNSKFELSNDLKNLMLTPPPASFNRMAKRISTLGRVKLALVSGVFLNKENVADLLIVGDDIDRRKFKNFLKSLEAEIGTQLIFAIMDKEEFQYRRAMFDRFVRLMLEGPHEVLIDRVGL